MSEDPSGDPDALKSVRDAIPSGSSAVLSQPSAEQAKSNSGCMASPNESARGISEGDVAARIIQQEIDDAVEANFQVWREARLKNDSHGFITVAEEAQMRRGLRELEAARRGVQPSPALAQPVQTLPRFLERSFPPKEPIIEGLLYRRDIVALAGRRRHGKTTFTGNLVLALTLPHPNFLGYAVPAPVRVLSLYLEDDAGELQMKLKRMCGDALPNERLALYTREDFHRGNIPIDATNELFQRFIIQSCSAHHPDVVILDNLAHLIGADYNNSKLIHQLSQFVWQISLGFNVAIIILAHPRKRDKKINTLGSNVTVRLRNDPEGFFEEVMGSSHFVNSCGSLWGIERDSSNDRTDFLGGAQRFTGQQSLMILEKDEHDWLRRVNDMDVNLPLALNTPARKRAWELLPEGDFSYSEAEKAVRPAIKSTSTFYEWFQWCIRPGVLMHVDPNYKKATPAHPGESRGT